MTKTEDWRLQGGGYDLLDKSIAETDPEQQWLLFCLACLRYSIIWEWQLKTYKHIIFVSAT